MAVNYFEPGSAIYILKDVPLDITYNHTWYFSTPQEQLDHFRRQTLVKQIGGTQYQRYDNTAINVQVPMSKLYGANYMYFVNDVVVDSGVDIGVDISGRRLKYFYAFITDVEYVNPNTSRIYYEIDYMQSFMFDYVLGDSFVVREHSKTDNIGDNIVNESFPELPYEYGQNTPDFINTRNWYICILTTSETTVKKYNNINGVKQYFKGLYCGNYNGLGMVCFEIPITADTDPNDNYNRQLNNISDLADNEDVVAVYMLPDWALPNTNVDISSSDAGEYSNYQPFAPKKTFNISNYNTPWESGWKPKNNKLYTFPFNKLSVFAQGQQTIDYRYEFFKGTKNFTVLSNTGAGVPSMLCFPNNYNGSQYSIKDGILLKVNTSSGFNKDNFNSWWQNNAISSIGKAVSAGFAGYTVAGVGGALAGLAGSAFNSIVNGIQEFVRPDISAQKQDTNIYTAIGGITDIYKGGFISDLFQTDFSMQTFYAYNFRVVEPIAKLIDEFFTMYGYATNRVKTPNRNVRSRFTYTQTNGCVFKKINLPQKFANKIASIYDKGITFWKPTATIGDYNSPNNVL